MDNYSFSMSDVSDDLGGIQFTSLSNPLGKMVSDNKINKPQKDKYQLNPYQIENYLKEMHRKHFFKKINDK